MKLNLILFLLILSTNTFSQNVKWPIPFYFNEYSRYCRLDDKVNLNDTFIFKHSSNIYFKFVLFEEKGKSYMEVYKNNKLYEKGYYENSLDTLKIYSKRLSSIKANGKIYVLKYFEPLKNGVWLETKNHKAVQRKYSMGVDVIDR